jgi:hypothetical protein
MQKRIALRKDEQAPCAQQGNSRHRKQRRIRRKPHLYLQHEEHRPKADSSKNRSL